MTAKPPASGLPISPDPMGEAEETAATLATLDVALSDTCLPASTRTLLERARDALRASRRDAEAAWLRYHALFDAVPDPVSILDAEGNVLDLNTAAMAAYRRPREEIIGQPIHVLNPDLPRDYLNPVWETLNRGETTSSKSPTCAPTARASRSRCIRPGSTTTAANASSPSRATSVAAATPNCATAN